MIPTLRSADRGQTTLDFAIGTSVFLLTIIFVLGFVPTMFDPFAGGTGSRLIVADRAATMLAGDVLAPSTSDPGTLAAGCVAGFFNGSAGNQTLFDDACPSEVDDVSDLEATLALDGAHIEVTIHELNESASTFDTLEWHDTTVDLQRSNANTVPGDVAVATRTVAIDGEQRRLTVRVW